MIKIFSGTSNPKLSFEVSRLLKYPISLSEVVRFDNSEVRVTIKEKVKNSTCIVIQSTSNPTDTHLMELFFFADALKRNGASEIIAFIPYFGYARQNREHLPGEAVSANVVIRFLEAIGFNAIYTVNIHDEATEGIFSVKFKNISAFPVLSQAVSAYLKKNKNKEKIAIVSPDQGGVERAQIFAENFFQAFPSVIPTPTSRRGRNLVPDIAVIEKKRNLKKLHQSTVLNLYGNVKNKTCILVDDIVTSGGTLIHAANFCLKKGAKRIIACVVHHDFSPTAPISLSKSSIEKIFITNTIALKPEQKFPQLEEISIAPLLVTEIKNI